MHENFSAYKKRTKHQQTICCRKFWESNFTTSRPHGQKRAQKKVRKCSKLSYKLCMIAYRRLDASSATLSSGGQGSGMKAKKKEKLEKKQTYLHYDCHPNTSMKSVQQVSCHQHTTHRCCTLIRSNSCHRINTASAGGRWIPAHDYTTARSVDATDMVYFVMFV